MHFLNFLSGSWQEVQTKDYFEVSVPEKGEDTLSLVASSPMDVVLAIQSCKKAEQKWSRFNQEKRQALLLKMAEIIESRGTEWAEQEARLTGMPEELLHRQVYRYAVDVLRQWGNKESLGPKNEEDSLYYNPVGTCALILPWVLGFRVFIERFAPAVFAGNTVIVKVSEFNPVIGRYIGEMLVAAEVPEGVCNMIQGRGEEVVPTLVGHPAIAAVDFVGRYATAEKIIQGAAQPGKRLRGLSGAKNSAVVLDDTDFEEILPRLLKSCFLGSGQLSQNISRIFVSTKRHAEFIETFERHLLAVQRGENDALPLRPLISQKAKEGVQQIHEQLMQENGKRVGSGPTEPHIPQAYYDLSMCSTLQQDELYGPIVLINEYKYLHEAEKWVNTGYHGQAAQIWGKDSDKITKLAAKLQVGTLWINTWFDEVGEAPWSQKSSSYGPQDPDSLDRFYMSFSRRFSGAL